jgi:hypothetical protein
MIKLYGDKNKRFFPSGSTCRTYLEYLTTKEILFDWKQSNGEDDDDEIKERI